MNHVDRVRRFLRTYPHDKQTNIDPEIVYEYNAVQLRWSDLDALCRDAERLAQLEDS